MSVLKRIAFFQNRRDEVPNLELAKDLAERGDRESIGEIVHNLHHENANVRSDCLKVLYEIGYLRPELIADYVGEFLALVGDKHNRMVWGGMIALSTIAGIRAGEIDEHLYEVLEAMQQGSVITRDNGVKVLATVASTHERRRKRILPHLLRHLKTCRPKDIPGHAEEILRALSAEKGGKFLMVLDKRMGELTPSQSARVRRVMRQAEKISSSG